MRTIQLILAGVLLLPASKSAGQEWIVPENQAAVQNPAAYTLENVTRGKEIYQLHCKSCHGDPGKNNTLALVPRPVDIASERMQANSEGAIFFKITNGKGVMPTFESTLPEDDRWMLVNFIMNFNPDREALLIEAPPIKAALQAALNPENRTVEITAEYEESKGKYASLSEAPVIISSRQAFGYLEIGQTITGEDGKAVFNIPEDVTGDEMGNVYIAVSLNDTYEAEEVALENPIMGIPKEGGGLIRPGVLWSTNENIPVWLLFSYLFAAGGAWIFIIYVILQIAKLKKYGKS